MTRTPPWYYLPMTVLIGGCLVAIVNFGVRSTFGLFTLPFQKRVCCMTSSVPTRRCGGCVALGQFAAVVHLPIRQTRAPAFAVA